jgi:hypothetical protein
MCEMGINIAAENSIYCSFLLRIKGIGNLLSNICLEVGWCEDNRDRPGNCDYRLWYNR